MEVRTHREAGAALHSRNPRRPHPAHGSLLSSLASPARRSGGTRGPGRANTGRAVRAGVAEDWSQPQRARLDLDGLPGGLRPGVQLQLVGQSVAPGPPPALLKYFQYFEIFFYLIRVSGLIYQHKSSRVALFFIDWLKIMLMSGI